MRGYTAKVGLRKPGTRPMWLDDEAAMRLLQAMIGELPHRTAMRDVPYDAGGLLPVVSQTFNASSEPMQVLTPELAEAYRKQAAIIARTNANLEAREHGRRDVPTQRVDRRHSAHGRGERSGRNPCTYTTECCHCDGTRTPLEDS